jgi:hypothetical protein
MTTTRRPEAGTDIWSVGGPWRFTRETVVTDAPAEALYRLYRPAFEPLKVRSAARQVLTRSEFLEQMRDDRVDKYVAWENDTDPIGMITLTRSLESVPWISPEYFAARYPDQWSRNAIYYLGIILAHPRNHTARFLDTIVRLSLEPLADERALIAYDMCHYIASRRLAERVAAVVREYTGIEAEELDRQLYYGVNFA